MMKEWRKLKLGDIAVISYGYTAKASVENVGSKFLRITDIQNDMVNWSSVPYCQITEDNFNKYKLIAQDIVFARTGATTGKSYLVCDPPEVVAASYLIRLRVQDPTVSAKFISKYFQTREYWDSVSSGISGSAQGGFNASKLSALAIPIPPLPEQKRIVAILAEAFEGIDRAIANTEKNLANARELFKSYLNAIFTQKGDGWEKKTLQEISIKFTRGKSKHRPRGDKKLYGGKYPLIQTGDISNSKHRITSYSQTYNELGLAQSEIWPQGTVCIAIVGANVAETAILDFDACFPDSVIGILVNKEVSDSDYVEYLFQVFKAELKEKGKGTARDNINLGTFANQRFPFPDVKTQKIIACQLEELSFETQRLENIYRQKIAALNELKQSILQKAFTGELTADTANQTPKAAQEVNAA